MRREYRIWRVANLDRDYAAAQFRAQRSRRCRHANLPIDDALQLSHFGTTQRLRVGEIEAQVRVIHQRAFLLDVVTEYFP